MKKKTVYFYIFLMLALVLSFYGALTFIFGARCGGQAHKDARIRADMMQTRALAEIYYSEKNSYVNFNCDSSEQTKIICEDIVAQGGIRPVFKSTSNEYCGYTQDKKQQYICVSHTGGVSVSSITPAYKYLCDGESFNCPMPMGGMPRAPSSLSEKFNAALPGYLFIIFLALALVGFIFGIILIRRPGKINKVMGLIIFILTLLLITLLFLRSLPRC